MVVGAFSGFTEMNKTWSKWLPKHVEIISLL
jgi:hypothetical protein